MFRSTQNRIILLMFALALSLIVGLTIKRISENNKIDDLLSERDKEKAVLLDKVTDFASKNLLAFTYDYTFWDEMVGFIKTPDMKWAKDNIDATIPSYKVDAAWVFRTDLSMVYSTNRIDTEKTVKFPLTNDLFRQLVMKGPFFHFFYRTGYGLMEISGASVHPTSDSARKTPAQGYFFVGKLWTDDYLKDISSIAESKISIIPINMIDSLRRNHNYGRFVIHNLKALNGWNGRSVSFISSISMATIAETSYKNSNFQYYSSIVYLCFVLLFLSIVLYFTVNRPLFLISRSLADNNPERIRRLLPKQNEFGRLAVLINDFFIQKIKLLDEITKHKEDKAALQESENKLKDINDLKDRFFAIIAHDLKNPFAQILGFSDELKENYRSYDAETLDTVINMLNLASKQANDLLENLLIWARSQSGRIEFVPYELDLNNCINENISLVSAQAVKKHIQLTADINEKYTVFADKNMINTVVRNLLTNAIKFTPVNGKVNISVSIEASGFVRVAVSDTGVGIEKENISKLFDMGSRYITFGTAKERGTGLGLLLCKEFVEKHHGRIWVESQTGKGSTFYFTLRNRNFEG